MDKFEFDFENKKDYFNFDDENNIMNLMLLTDDSKILLLNGNSFERKLKKFFHNIRSFTVNSGHNCPPPDFYSDKFSCMFDVLRINDTENSKKYNPVLIKERKMNSEFEKVMEKELGPDLYKEYCSSPFFNVINIPESSGDVNEHSYPKYKKQAIRVIKQHIDKVYIWKKDHPDIKYKGLFIFDETGLCISAYKKHLKDDYFSYTFKDKPIIHETWRDENFIRPIYESEIDFVIWYNPYKSVDDVLHQYNMSCTNKKEIKYPALVIADTRYPKNNYQKYDEEDLVMTT